MKLLTQLLLFWNVITTFGEGEDDDKGEEAEESELFGDDFDMDDPDAGEGNDDDEEEEEEKGEDEEDSDDDDDEDDDENAESEDDDTDSEGEGGEEDEGVDPAVARSIQVNWETRLAAEVNQDVPDIAAALDATDVVLTEAQKKRVKAYLEDEDDVGAMTEVVKTLIPRLLGTYDQNRIVPTLDEMSANERKRTLISQVDAFDKANPGARTRAVNKRMADQYDAFRKKYGWQAADKVPVEDYFFMAGGKSGKKKTSSERKKAASSKKSKAEGRKKMAAKATKKPDRLAGKSGKPGGKKKKQSKVSETFDSIQSTAMRRDPFFIR